MSIDDFISFFRDRALVAATGMVALAGGIATVAYNYCDFQNRQSDQLKKYADQFEAAVKELDFSDGCRADFDKLRLQLMTANITAGRIEQQSRDGSYREVLDPLLSRFIVQRARCDVEATSQKGLPDTPFRALTRSITRGDIQLREATQPTSPGAKWFAIVASLPSGYDAWPGEIVCGWRAKYEDFNGWGFQVWRTSVSQSVVITLDGEQTAEAAAQKVQFVRSNPQLETFFYDAYAQINRNWTPVTAKIDCPAAGKPGQAISMRQ